jgi:hypothetical protein
MGLSYDDYSEREGREIGLKRKLGNKNAKLLLECTEKNCKQTSKGSISQIQQQWM